MARIKIALAAAAATVPAAVGGPPGPVSFQNVTTSRVNPTISEIPNNEKEVDFGDFDNDGDLDVVIANAWGDFGQRNNKLYRNDEGVFNEVSGAPVIPGFWDPKVTNFNRDVARNAFLRDYDGDGWLDIIIVVDNNTPGDAGRTKVYINQHPGGEFSHYTEEGIERLGEGTGGAACGAVSVDVDNDSDVDLYVGNYPGPPQDTLYLNDGDGYFTEVTETNVPPEEEPVGDYTVDVASADLNGDGTLDLLVSNWFQLGGPACKAYYNDKLGAGSGPGDFLYPGSVQVLGVAGVNENAMEPGDFDGDGDVDVYWSNRSGASGGDRILENLTLDPFGAAVFITRDGLPASVDGVLSRKATVADVDGDGRPDVFVCKEADAASRPTLLRNTSVGDEISFVDWTPASGFPGGIAHMGWHAAIFDSNGDGDLDVFLGGWSGDHLFEQVRGPAYLEGNLPGGVVPGLFNQDPAAVYGTGGAGESDSFLVTGLSTNAFLSVVLGGGDDYLLEVLDVDDQQVLASSDRGGAGVEEALQFDPDLMPSTVALRVTLLSCGTPLDLAGDCGVGQEDLEALIMAWGEGPGHRADFDGDGVVGITDLIELLGGWGPSPWVLEVLARSG